MKKYLISALLLGFFTCLLAPACSQKSGCPAQESLAPKTNKKGEIIPRKKGKSELFSKSMRKKMH